MPTSPRPRATLTRLLTASALALSLAAVPAAVAAGDTSTGTTSHAKVRAAKTSTGYTAGYTKAVKKCKKLKTKPKRTKCVTAAKRKYKKPPKATPAPQPPVPADPPTTGDQFTSDRQAVNDAYFADWAPAMNVPIGFTGDTATCDAGTSSDKARAAQVTQLNFVRRLAGLSPVVLAGKAANDAAQETALLMGSHGLLDHYPDPSWRCYTERAGATAADSLLHMNSGGLSAGGPIASYLVDDGPNNTAVGHRRWLLWPELKEVASGSTNGTNAFTVINLTKNYSPKNPAWVSWPTAGQFPAPLDPAGRWSLSAGDKAVNFKNATVAVTLDGQPMAASVHQVANGYGRPTLVWEMPSASPSGSYTVTVSNIGKQGSTQKLSHTYTVHFFSPTG